MTLTPAASTPLIEPAAFIKRMRWVMVAVILVDIAITFFGQPASYWQNPATVHEGNKLFHLIMSQGWAVAMVVDLVYVVGSFVLVSVLPWRLAMTLLFSLLLGHYFGGSSWLCFRHGFGVQGMVIYGIVVALLLTGFGFRADRKG